MLVALWCSVAWTRKSVPTPGSESLQRRATQPCVSISSFKASISFLTTKHTARSDDPVLLPATHRTVRPTRNLFFHLFPRGCLFYFPFLSSSILLPSLPLLFRFLLLLLLHHRPLRPDTDVRGSSTSAAGDIVRNVVARLSWLAAHLARVNFVPPRDTSNNMEPGIYIYIYDKTC